MRKPDFCLCKNKGEISFTLTAKLINAFVFATRIVQFLYFLNPEFPASSHLLCLYSSVCVGPGLKPRRPVFSRHGSNRVTNEAVIVQPCICKFYWSFIFLTPHVFSIFLFTMHTIQKKIKHYRSI